MALAAVAFETQPSAQGVLGVQQSRALADMRAYIARVKPQSAAEALRLLRNAYPQSSLSLRVTAAGL